MTSPCSESFINHHAHLPWTSEKGLIVKPGDRPIAEEPPGLYIHVPFCKRKCAYCDFYSVPDVNKIPEWINCILKEANLSKGLLPPFDTLYMGGGTPSLLQIVDLERLIKGLHQELNFSSDLEITLEANPDDLSSSKLTSYRSLGIDRISLGVQSLDEDSLKLLARRHSAKAAERAIDEALSAGFSSVGVDLIYGIPGQSGKAWMDTLEKVISLGPNHISCYQLTLSNGTPLDRLRQEGRVNLPNDDTLADLFLLTSETLESKGYIHYEVSNFALPGHLSRHNHKYWRRTPYLGLGPGAHSFLSPVRWWNPKSIDAYIERLLTDRHPFEGRETLSTEQAYMEMLCLGLRNQEGVKLVDLVPSSNAHLVAKELEMSGLVVRKSGRIVPTAKGYLVADSLPLRFL